MEANDGEAGSSFVEANDVEACRSVGDVHLGFEPAAAGATPPPLSTSPQYEDGDPAQEGEQKVEREFVVETNDGEACSSLGDARPGFEPAAVDTPPPSRAYLQYEAADRWGSRWEWTNQGRFWSGWETRPWQFHWRDAASGGTDADPGYSDQLEDEDELVGSVDGVRPWEHMAADLLPWFEQSRPCLCHKQILASCSQSTAWWMRIRCVRLPV